MLVDLASAPGRTLVFTRTKHGAKTLTRQLNARGVPAVELHGNLGQNARTRNLEAFSRRQGRRRWSPPTSPPAASTSTTSALVVHADPPVEHKAYLHRSGRTARAGNAGTVITLMTDDQVARRARPDPGGRHQADDHPDPAPTHPVLAELAPGERVLSGSLETTTPSSSSQTRSGGGGGGRNRRGGGRGRGGSGSSSSQRSPQQSSGQKSSGQKSSGQKSSGQKSGGNRSRRPATAGRTSSGGNHSAASFSGRR